jgi:DHA1 family bicyclomycin/chloramphenicol resistance-like MFS transporter
MRLRTAFSPRKARPPLWLLVAITASGTLAMHILVPALPAVARDLAVSAGEVQLTITLYVAGLAAGQLVYGPLSDRFGRRPVLLGALVLYTAGGLAAWLAADLHTLVFARVLQALGGCGGLVLGRAIVRDLTSPAEAAAQLALLNLAVSAAPALAPIVGGYLAIWAGWRTIFALLALLGLATLSLSVVTVGETWRGGERGRMLRSYLLLLGSATFRRYAIGGACMTTAMYAFLSASPFIFTATLHRPAEEVGFYYLLIFSGVSLGSVIANRTAGRFPARPMLLVTSLVSTASATVFFAAAVSGNLTLALTLATIILFTVSAGAASPIALTGAIGVHPGAIGAAAGLYGFWQMSFGALCTLVVSIWHDDPAISAGAVLMISAIVAVAALSLATRRAPA